MNSLYQTFHDYFSKFYYYDNSGRAYLEHSCSSKQGYTGIVGFFHFALEDRNKNIFYNYQIYKFIEQYYETAFIHLSPLLQYCIHEQILISLISISHNEFTIRISGGDEKSRDMILNIYSVHTGEGFSFSHTNFTCPVELHIGAGEDFIIYSINVFQKTSIPKETTFREGYLEEENIFLTIGGKKYKNNHHSFDISNAFKLNEPIHMQTSVVLNNEYYQPFLRDSFPGGELFVNCIEQKENEDIIFFTENYCIEA